MIRTNSLDINSRIGNKSSRLPAWLIAFGMFSMIKPRERKNARSGDE
jgi:hypothetical protein